MTIHGLRVWDRLKEELHARGHRFYSRGPRLRRDGARPTIALWDFGSVARLPRAEAADARGRVVAWCLESPLIAHRGYHRIDSVVRQSVTTLAFSGARDIARDRDGITPILYPISQREPVPDEPRSQRDLLVMIATNKHRLRSQASFDVRTPYRSARIAAARLLAATYRLRRTWSAPDLYAKRLEALEYLAGRPGFSLFGSGWRSDSVPASLRVRVGKSYRGVTGDKIETLRRFRFCLCFENTVFPGYVTEKIFDCFSAGTIPIYLGAPDIGDLVPAESFIDARSFSDYPRLLQRIQEISPDEEHAYVEVGKEFMSSKDFQQRFSDERFVETLLNAILRAERRG